MDSNKEIFMDKNNQDKSSDYEIDIKDLLEIFIRNKKLIFLITIIGIFFGSIYSFKNKRIWQGEFQIVLEQPQAQGSLIDPKIAKFANLNQESNPLETEVGILKSPSVLMNIFEFIKEEKKIINNSEMNELRFKSWKKNQLDINLERGTSILNIAYQDSDKKLIIPVLKKISSEYQEYSGKNKKRQINLGLEYFNNQIKLFKEKSIQSYKKAQKFALENNLAFFEINPNEKINLPKEINIEMIRLRAINEIELIDERMNIFEAIERGEENIVNFALTLKGFSKDLLNRIKELNIEILELKEIYRENDESVVSLENKKKFILDSLDKQISSFLKAQKADKIALLNSAERPIGTLTNYSQLVNSSLKDQFTLQELEDNYRNLLLEKARIEDPWQLITKPTLLPYPVAPSRKKILAISLLLGFFIGYFIALFKEKTNDIIYSTKELKINHNYNFLYEIDFDKTDEINDLLKIMLKDFRNMKINEIQFLQVADFDSKEGFNVNDILFGEINYISNIAQLQKSTHIMLVIALGWTSLNDIIKLKRKLNILDKNVIGIVALRNLK